MMDNNPVKAAARVALAEKSANKQRAAIVRRAEADIKKHLDAIARHQHAIADVEAAMAVALAAHDVQRAQAVAAARGSGEALVHGPHPVADGRNACGNRGARTGALRLVTCPECRAVLVDAGLLTPKRR